MYTYIAWITLAQQKDTRHSLRLDCLLRVNVICMLNSVAAEKTGLALENYGQHHRVTYSSLYNGLCIVFKGKLRKAFIVVVFSKGVRLMTWVIIASFQKIKLKCNNRSERYSANCWLETICTFCTHYFFRIQYRQCIKNEKQ